MKVIILAAMLNIALIVCVIFSVISAFHDARNASFSQNIENVRTLTNASANKIELEISHHAQEVKNASGYINQYNGTGMTLEEVRTFFRELYLKNADESFYTWQLIDCELNNQVGAGLGFDGISLSDSTGTKFTYKAQMYPKLATIFYRAGENMEQPIHYTSEFTDASSKLEKSFAITAPVRIVQEDAKASDTTEYVGETVQYKTLMLLIESDYMNELIENNNEINTLSFFDYSNIIIDNDGNYVISNSYFQGTNICDYISLYNPKFHEENEPVLLKHLTETDYSDVLYYQNNREQDCAYVIVPIQNSDWHMLSIVPLASFHNAYDFNRNFILFALFFTLLFLVNIVFVLMINYQLRHRTKEAQAANIAKSRFLSSMSHDIRTPINAIVGMTIIADENLKRENPDVAVLKECVRTIKLSGNHLLTLINDILDISKIEDGKISVNAEDFSMCENMHKILEIIQPDIKNKQFEFEIHMDQIQHEFVHADALRINQIYLNILSNAIKYTNPGGVIQVELREEAVLGAKDRARYIYRVTDNGIGMSQEFLKTIFDRFSRAVDTRVNTTQGTGLGMAISKQLVDMMGGTIEVESELNVGSAFTVALELQVVQMQTQINGVSGNKPEAISDEKTVFHLNILVVEDNDINWEVLGKVLELYGIQADRAENGQEAVEKVKNSDVLYDIIFMDIQMPVMNGYDAAEEIRNLKDQRKASIPIYAMTADTFAEDVAKCKAKGMNGHLAKPIEVDKLLKILKQY